MQLNEFLEILEHTRRLVANTDLYYKEVILEILDALAWIVNFLVRFSFEEIIIDLLAESFSGSNSNFNTLGHINSETTSQNDTDDDSAKQSIIVILKKIAPYTTEGFQLVQKLYLSDNKENLESCVNNQILDNIASGLQYVGYVLKFGFLVYGFYVVLSAKESNLTQEKRDELNERIEEIKKLIEKANTAFEQKNSQEFMRTDRKIKDKVDDMNNEILKLEFKIKDKMYSLRATKNMAEYSVISSVIGAATNAIDIARDPKCLLPKVLFSLDVIIGVGSAVTLKMSIDSLKDFQKSLVELEDFRKQMIKLRDIQSKKYDEYMEKQ